MNTLDIFLPSVGGPLEQMFPVKKRQIRWFRHLIRMPRVCLPGLLGKGL